MTRCGARSSVPVSLTYWNDRLVSARAVGTVDVCGAKPRLVSFAPYGEIPLEQFFQLSDIVPVHLK